MRPALLVSIRITFLCVNVTIFGSCIVAINMLITAFETILFFKVVIDWNWIVMLSGPPWVLAEVMTKSGHDYCFMQALGNMNEQDVNENSWPSSYCCVDGYLCSVLFLGHFFFDTFFQNGQLIARVLWSVSSSQLIHFRLLEVHSWCVCSREEHSEHIL